MFMLSLLIMIYFVIRFVLIYQKQLNVFIEVRLASARIEQFIESSLQLTSKKETSENEDKLDNEIERLNENIALSGKQATFSWTKLNNETNVDCGSGMQVPVKELLLRLSEEISA